MRAFIQLFVALLVHLPNLASEELQFYSQYQQDKYLYENVFKDKKNGVFVDIGAHDGITLSNTYFFERFQGWKGICVEPIPDVFARLKKNRTCICVHGCIYNKKKFVPFFKIQGWAEMLSGIIENYDPKHMERIQWEIGLNGGTSEIITVECFDINQLLAANNIKHIDYMSIDTEGGELNILKSIDFSRFDIDIIEAENNYGEPFATYLETYGYKKIAHLGPDEVFQKVTPNEVPL